MPIYILRIIISIKPHARDTIKNYLTACNINGLAYSTKSSIKTGHAPSSS